MKKQVTGIQAALLSAIFLGLAPVFGKQAISLGLPWLGVVAVRTGLAALLLVLLLAVFRRKYFYIYPAGLLGCLLAGGLNGAGSLLYYGALERIDAGLGQLLYSLYPLFLALVLRIDHQPLSRLTRLRLLVILPAVFLLTQSGSQPVDLLGIGMMLGASLLYALHLPVNQRVLYDMPAPTVTLYTLVAMTGVVAPVYLVARLSGSLPPVTGFTGGGAWNAVLALTLVTFFSRLLLFTGVKKLGGLQTAILGLSELIVTMVFAQLLLGERFTSWQWAGAALLITGLGLVAFERSQPRKPAKASLLDWIRPAGLPHDITWPPAP